MNSKHVDYLILGAVLLAGAVVWTVTFSSTKVVRDLAAQQVEIQAELIQQNVMERKPEQVDEPR